MNQSYPVPPPELVGEWLCSEDYQWGPLEQGSVTITTNRLKNVATQAAQWGADQELEACCQSVKSVPSPLGVPFGVMASNALRAARRPKPPSLKEQALEQLGCIQTDLNKFGMGISTDTIRRALESLDD